MITHNILICDEFPLISIGMEIVIKKKYPYCQIYRTKDFSDVLGLLSALSFDLLFIDISKNGFNEYSILNKIKILQPKLNLIVFSFINEFDFKDKCFKYGADAVFNKNCTEESLEQVVNIYLFAGSLFSKKIKLFLEIKPLVKKSSLISTKTDTLSSREYEIASLLISGELCKDIATKLQITRSTVSTYKKRIMLKTSTKNLLQLEKVFISNNYHNTL
jgi:two-component system, NarL family, invasion response regulator UvrY